MKHNLLAGIPEKLTRFVQLPNEEGHNAVWDFVRSPDNRFYISVCGENEKPLTALLYEYYPKTGELRLIFDVAKIWIVDTEQMPPSKIHTSIDFLPDGRLIMATHNTAPAPRHKQWMFEQHYEDPWEGYPGSILMIVDPDTNKVEIKGIPVPRESIYGGMLGDDPRYYYFLGYMRGHFYRIDLETNEVKDYGKTSEFSSCRLVKDDKGRFYGSSYTGGIWRFDPETDQIQDLKVSFVSPNGMRHRRQFIFAVHSPRNSLFLVDNVDSEMIELFPDTLEVIRHGHIHLPEELPISPYGIGGLAADENFVLYYGLKVNDGYCPIRLVRWDILNGGKPENLGLVSPGGKDSQYICEMIFDSDGWLQMVDVCGEFSPYILAVDVKKLNPPGPDTPNVQLKPYWESDYNGVGAPAFMHIVSESTRTVPLHQHMDWKDTTVKHVREIDGRVYTISGKERVYVTESDFTSGKPLKKAAVYDSGASICCTEVSDRMVAVLTSDRKIVLVDLVSGSSETSLEVLAGFELAKFHTVLDSNRLLASDRDGIVYICDYSSGTLSKLDNIIVNTNDGYIIKLDDNRLLLSGNNDEIMIYDIGEMRSEKLDVKSASIRGRAFKATITGGTVLGDGTIIAGTYDGMLFSLTPDLSKTTYGRLYSSGLLRNFIKLNDDEVVGIYGAYRDAGHVFHFSCKTGFVDLGRPRVLKDNNEVSKVESEWANIHRISCLSYDQGEDSLCVASEEEYGSVIQYKGIAFPGR